MGQIRFHLCPGPIKKEILQVPIQSQQIQEETKFKPNPRKTWIRNGMNTFYFNHILPIVSFIAALLVNSWMPKYRYVSQPQSHALAELNMWFALDPVMNINILILRVYNCPQISKKMIKNRFPNSKLFSFQMKWPDKIGVPK